MNLTALLARVKAGVDRLAEILVPEGSYIPTVMARAILYVLVFVGLPLLILVSLPYGVGIILLIAVVLLVILGLPGNF